MIGLRLNLTCKEKKMKIGSDPGCTFRKETSIDVPGIPATAPSRMKTHEHQGGFTSGFKGGHV